MSNAIIPVIKFLFRDQFKVLNETLNIQPTYDLKEFSHPSELANFISAAPASLVLASLRDKNDLIQIATLMRLTNKIGKDAFLKIVVFNFCTDKSFENAVVKLGVSDIIDAGINTKALKFKLDFWMRTLKAQVRLSQTANNHHEANWADTPQMKSQGDKRSDLHAPIWAEPLELEDDIWLLKSEEECKKVLSKWLIRLTGPSPYIGQWNELKAGLWKFDVKEHERKAFSLNKGAWYFSGDHKPDFVWKENVWMISGEAFELFFKDDARIFSRLRLRDKTLTICKNSAFAKTKEKIITESFEKELAYKREAERIGDMRGENKTDHLSSGNLQGKTKTPGERSGNLSGKLEGGEALSGKGLEQKIDSTDRVDTRWNGKLNNDRADAQGALGVKPEDANHSDAPGLEVGDQTHKKFYKNHNEAEVFGKGNLTGKRKPGGEGADDDNLAGRNSQDSISGFYDGKRADKAGSKELPERAGRDSAPGGEYDPDGNYQGKTSTDRVSSHYGKSAGKSAETKGQEESDKAQKSGSFSDELERQRQEKRSAKERELKRLEEAERKGNTRAKSGGSEDDAQRSLLPDEASGVGKKKPEGSADLADVGSSLKAGEAMNQPLLKGAGKTDTIRTRYDEKIIGKKNSDQDQDSADSTPLSFAAKKSADLKKADPYYSLKVSKDPAEADEEVIVNLDKARDDKTTINAKAVDQLGLDELTSEAKVKAILRQQGRDVSCAVDDFFDETIVFSTTSGALEKRSVTLEVTFDFMEKETKLKINGDVSSIEDDGEGTNYVTVQISSENASSFSSFMSLYQQRQENIGEFLKRTKGL